MDGIVNNISRQWDALVIQVDSCIHHCIHVCQYACNDFAQMSQSIFNSAWNNQLKVIFQRALTIFQSTGRRCATALAQPSDVYYQITDLARTEMPVIYPGGIGFMAGAIVGVMVGLAWHIKIAPVQRMKAVVSLNYKGLDTLAYVEDAILPCITKPHEILVQVKSASVDVIDIKVSYGYGRALRSLLNTPSRSELPVVLGRDCTGVVVEIGAEVNNFDIGDEVWLVSPFWSSGTIAEYVVATEDMVAKKPGRLTFEAAASIPYAGCLAYNACLKAGILDNNNGRKRVLIHSGVSAAGCIACQLAKLNNCEVTVTCSASGSAVAKFLQADRVIVYGEIEMENELSQDRFDVVLNTVGGVSHESCEKLCKQGGIVVSTVPELISYDDYRFPLSLFHSLYLRVQYFYKKMANCSNQWGEVNFSAEILDKLRELVDSRLLFPVVDKIFEPKDAIIALQHCDSVHAIGKTVIKIS